MPLCPDCRAEAEVTTRNDNDPESYPEIDEPCSRCGEQ